MRSINRFLLCCWLCLVYVQVGLGGSIVTKKSGTNQPLVVNYTPDPDGTTSTGELDITISTSGGMAATADRNLNLVLFMSGPAGKSVAYSVPIVLPQGALTAKGKLHFLQPAEWGYWALEVYEDGQSILPPNSALSTINNAQRKNWLEITPSVNAPNGTTLDFGLIGAIATSTQLSFASEDWRTYTAFDAVTITSSQLAIASPQQIRALSTYVFAGGSLIVLEADGSTPLAIDRLLGAQEDLATPDYRWKILADAKIGKYGSKRSHGAGIVLSLEQATELVREHVRGSTQFPQSEIASSGDSDFRWFWRNLIQSVGTAPVWSFIGFVTLFVVVVGPMTFRMTKVMRHRTLLLFLVPAVSLIATLLVLLYNVVREGFGTHGRIASIQYLDEHTGQGFAWSRQTYFSGSPSREGLKFPIGSLLKPVDGDTSNHRRYYYRDPRERVSAYVGSDGESEVISGWLTPRNQQQLMVGHRCDKSKLPIAIQRKSATVVSITNLTDKPIPLVFLRESAEVAYFAEALQPGQPQEVIAESADKIDSSHKTSNRNFQPVEPTAIDLNQLLAYGYYTGSRSSDPIDNAISKFSCSRLDDFGFWILSRQVPDYPLPFDRSVYASDEHLNIMTGVTKW